MLCTRKKGYSILITLLLRKKNKNQRLLNNRLTSHYLDDKVVHLKTANNLGPRKKLFQQNGFKLNIKTVKTYEQ